MDKYTINAVIRAVDKFSPVMKRMSANMKSFGKSARGFGKTATAGMTAPIVAFGAVTLKSAVDFERSMNRIEALSGETGDSLTNLRKLALDLGSSTAFSAKQSADAMGFFAQAGWDANQVLAATPAILNLAAASNTDLARSADIASNIMGQFKIPAMEASRVADVLAATTASANVDMEMLAESFAKAGPVARRYGLTLEDTAAAVGLLGNVGIQGSTAGTAMKNAMLAMVNPVGEAGKMLKFLGVATKDAQGDLLPLADVMADFANGIGSLGSGDQLKAINLLFGKISLAGASELMDQAKTGKFQEYADSLKNVEGRAKSMAEILLKGAPGAMARFTSAFEGMTLAIASSGLLDWFSETLIAVTGFFTSISKTSPELLKIGVIIAGVVAVAGPLLIAIGMMSTGFGVIASGTVVAWAGLSKLVGFMPTVASGMVTAFTAITSAAKVLFAVVAANPIILIFGAIAIAVAAAAYVIYDNWDNIANFFSEQFEAIGKAFDEGFLSGMVELVKRMNPFTLLKEAADGLFTYLTGIDLGQWMTSQVQAMISNMPDWAKDFIGIDSANAGGSNASTSRDVQKVVQASGQGANKAEAEMTIKFENEPPGMRTFNKVKGNSFDFNVARGSAFGP